MTWVWDWAGGEVLAAFVMAVGLSDGTYTPVMVDVARPVEQRWVDDMPLPLPGECRFYDVAAEDLAGNRSAG